MHKTGKTAQGEIKHYSVGIILEKDGKIFLIDRNNFPLGWACPAGHINDGETAEESAKREIREEIGCDINSLKFLSEEPDIENKCKEGVKFHHWFGFTGKIDEKHIKISKKEAKGWQWREKERLKDLQLEPIWEWYFKRVGWIK